MSARECDTSRECAIFDNNTKATIVPKLCIKGVCHCDPFYGWTGEECSEATVQLWILRIALAVFMLFCILLLLLSCKYLVKVSRSSEKSGREISLSLRERQQKIRSRVVGILLFNILGQSLSLLVYFNLLKVSIVSTYFQYSSSTSRISSPADDHASITIEKGKFLNYALLLGLHFLILSSFVLVSLIMLFLHDISFLSSSSSIICWLLRINHAVKFWLLLNAFVLPILLALNVIDAIYIIIIGNSFLLFILLLVGQSFVAMISREFDVDSSLLTGMFSVVRRQIAGLLVVVISCLIFLFLDYNINHSFHAKVFSFYAIYAGYLWLSIVAIHYCKGVIQVYQNHTICHKHDCQDKLCTSVEN